MDVKNFLTSWNTFCTVFVLFPAIACLGAYLTVKLRWIQLTKLRLSLQQLIRKETNTEGNISHYQAVTSVLAGNLGTGNISGMAIALTTGGPGALVWMWIMAFFGAAIQYTSCFLGVAFRQKNEHGEFTGGPMFYLSKGLKLKKLATLFSFVTVLGAFTVGNFAQVHSISLPLEQLGVPSLVSGLCIALLTCTVILGGIQRVAKVAASIVPVMALFYLTATLIILALHAEKILPSLELMLQSAFNGHAALGGVFGYGVMQAITAGFDRGLFATDAGIGIVPILQSSAHTKNPVINGVVTLVAPFLVMTVCTATGLVLLVTGAWQQPDLQSTNMVTYAFEQGLQGKVGFYVVLTSLFLFAYTSVIAWAICGQKAMQFLSAKRVRHFQWLYIVLIPFGTVFHVDIVWALADLCISFMLICNLIGVAGLSSQVISSTNAYFQDQRAACELLPIFLQEITKADDV
jgi:AGCS family alanine or glycine:cation symporter